MNYLLVNIYYYYSPVLFNLFPWQAGWAVPGPTMGWMVVPIQCPELVQRAPSSYTGGAVWPEPRSREGKGVSPGPKGEGD